MIWILSGVLGSRVASNRGHSGCGWIVNIFLLGPLFLVWALIVSPMPNVLVTVRKQRSGLVEIQDIDVGAII